MENLKRTLTTILLCVAIAGGFTSCGEKNEKIIIDGGGSEIVQSPIAEEPTGEPEDDVPMEKIAKFHYYSGDWQIRRNNYWINEGENGELFAEGWVYDGDVDDYIRYCVPLTDEKYMLLEKLVEEYNLMDWDGFRDFSDDDIANGTIKDFAFGLSIYWSDGGYWADGSSISANGVGSEYPENFAEADEAIRDFFKPLGEGKKAEGTIYKREIEFFLDEPETLSFIVPTGCSVGSVTVMNKSNWIVNILDEDGNVVCRVCMMGGNGDFVDLWENNEFPNGGNFGVGEEMDWEDVWVYGKQYQKASSAYLTAYSLFVMKEQFTIECPFGNESVAEKIAGTLEY